MTRRREQVASLLDLAGMKAYVVQKRAEWKDYVDVAALIDAGVTLPMALTAGQTIYKNRFQALMSVKFGDGTAGVSRYLTKGKIFSVSLPESFHNLINFQIV